MSHVKKGGGAGDPAGGGSRHAVLRRLAGRGGDGAEQSDQIMSGVCGHWVKEKNAAYLRYCPASGAGYRRGGFIDQPASAELSQGRTVSGRRENRLRAGAELLLLPGSLRCLVLSGRFRRWWVLPSSASPIISQVSSFCWESCWDALSAAFCVPSAGFRSCCIRFLRRSSPQRGSDL